MNSRTAQHHKNGARSGKKPVLITGGCGFIGTNLAVRLLEQGTPVLLYDNLSRPGVERNLQWLQQTYGHQLLRVEIADTRDGDALSAAVQRAAQVFHFAAQVAVTTSLTDPRIDFDVNLGGTLNLLEAIRAAKTPPPLVFTSTNKVYGGLHDLEMRETDTRYEPADGEIQAHGISERRPLKFESPYGCSKGAADQYILDYAHSYGLRTVVFRMSCIYGTHQFGTEDQGWVAHFLIRALQGKPITLYGDGKQVRDILFADDLIDAMLLAQEHMDDIAGQPFNIGGGPSRTISLLELLEQIEALRGVPVKINYGDWRTGDQRYYASDTEKFRRATGWRPKVGANSGIERLYEWLLSSAHHEENRGRRLRQMKITSEAAR